MLGVWQRIITFLAEAWKDVERVLPEKATEPPEQPADSFVMVPQSDLLDSVQKSLTASIVDSLTKNPLEQGEFFAGLSEGHELLLDANGHFTGDRGRTKVYLELLGRWMEIEQMRNAEPPQSCFELYQLLAADLGDPSCERYNWFFDVCKKIGLHMGTPGRPRNSANK